MSDYLHGTMYDWTLRRLFVCRSDGRLFTAVGDSVNANTEGISC